MKILYVNVYEGCLEEERFGKLVAFVKGKSPDVLGLSELNDWNRKNYARLELFKRLTGLKYSAFCVSKHGYHIGLFSRSPLRKTKIITRGMWHGAIISNLMMKGRPYKVVVTHLSPKTEDQRVAEAGLILDAVKGGRKVILMGDLNSLSPLDVLDDKTLLSTAKRINLMKFGAKKLRREVIQRLMDGGFVDTLRSTSNRFEYSVPSSYNKDPDHFSRLRLDYIFVTKDLRGRIKDAEIIRTRETDSLSDHYPEFLLI